MFLPESVGLFGGGRWVRRCAGGEGRGPSIMGGVTHPVMKDLDVSETSFTGLDPAAFPDLDDLGLTATLR